MLKENEELLKNLDLVFDKLNDGLLLLSLSGKILQVNKALLDMGGYEKKELLGKSALKLVKIFPPESMKKIASSFVDAAKGVPGDRYEVEAKTTKGEARIIELSNSIIKKDNKTIGIAVSVRDTTDRVGSEKELKEYKNNITKIIKELTPALQKAAMGDFSQNVDIPEKENEFTELLVALNLMINDLREYKEENREKIETKAKELRKKEQQYKILFESSRDAIMMLAPPTWRFIANNPATLKMFKCKNNEEFNKLGPWNISPSKQPDGKDSSSGAEKMIKLAMKEGSSSFEWTHMRLDGEEFLASVLLTRIELEGRKLLQATVRDITGRKKAEIEIKEKMQEVEKMNQLMVGRELKMVELKEKIKELESGVESYSETKNWKEKFEEAVELEEEVIRQLQKHIVRQIDESNLNIFKKNKTKKLLQTLIDESIEHEGLFRELIKYENEKRK